jgi:hypothetical protein
MVFHVFASGDRAATEGLLASDYVFYSPPDPGLDRAGYFERCWPMPGTELSDFVRMIESGD